MKLASVVLAVACLLVAAPAAGAATSYKFKADVTVFQEAEWQVVSQTDDLCSGSNVFNVYAGQGEGYLRASGRRKSVTFRKTRAGLQSSALAVPGFAVRDAAYSSSREGSDEDCDPPAPATVDTGACGLIVKRKGTARLNMLLIGGRLSLTGGLYEPPTRPRCPDASGYTGGIGYAGPARSRKDVDKLIQNPRVRSIELGASAKNKSLEGNVSPSPAFNLRSSSGTGTARWSVKLTRVKK